jgi:glyoxylase-like metal-dependent hydrolase (beta-lactamase superfamily II)
MVNIPQQQIPGFYHREVGDIVVTTVSDGYLDGNCEVLKNIPIDEAQRMMEANFSPVRRASVNTFVIHSGDRKAVIDTGSGDYLMKTAGWQQRNLAAAGIDPASIDTILLTHMHPDHSAGLADRRTGERFFPNAELVMGEAELRHWSDDRAMAQASEREKLLYFQCGREQVAPYKDRTRLIAGGEVFPGVTALPSSGHTPGHMMYRVESGGQSLLIWGDTIHVPEIQIVRPEVCIEFDTDKPAAAAARRRVFDMVASDGTLVTGMHMHFPGFGRIVRDGATYRLLPEPWVQAF